MAKQKNKNQNNGSTVAVAELDHDDDRDMASAPDVVEDVESSEPDVESVGDKPKKRGRRRAEDDPRPEFKIPADMLNDEGDIKVWRDDCGYRFGSQSDEDSHKPLLKEAFATDEVHMDYRIAKKRFDMSLIQEEIDDMIKQRDLCSGIEDETARETAKKAVKAKNQLAKLKKELAAAGVDVKSLLSNGE